MPNIPKNAENNLDQQRFENNLQRIYKWISIRYTDNGDAIGVSLEWGNISIMLNKNNLSKNNLNQYISQIIWKIELIKLIAIMKSTWNSLDVQTYEKYNNTSSIYSTFYRFIFQIITLNNSNIPPLYYNEIKSSLQSTVKNIQNIYKELPRHLQFLLGLYNLNIQDEEVKQALEELKKAGIITKISDPRIDIKEKLTIINEELLPNFIYFLKKDKKAWKPKKKSKKTQNISPETPEETQNQPWEAENAHQNDYVENPDDFADESDTDNQEEGWEWWGWWWWGGGWSWESSWDTWDADGWQSPDYKEQYDTPEWWKFEKNNSNKPWFKIEIFPPMRGYFVIDNKSQFNTQTNKWLNIARMKRYNSQWITFTGKKHTLSTTISWWNLKSIPLPKWYALDLNSLTYLWDKPEFFRDENGYFFLKIKNQSEISIDFYEEQPIFSSSPIQEDSEKLYQGNLTQKAQEALQKAKNEKNFKKKVKILLEYVTKFHFYPPGKNSQETMNNAKNIQANLTKRSQWWNYIQNLDTSKHLECYSANTLFIALLRNIWLESRLATWHHLQWEVNKLWKSEIKSSNGHAWAVVWDGKEWIGFDATPKKDPNDPRNKKDPNEKDEDEDEKNENTQIDKANDWVEENDDNSWGDGDWSSWDKSKSGGKWQPSKSDKPSSGDSSDGESSPEWGEWAGEAWDTQEKEYTQEEIEKELEQIYEDFKNDVANQPEKSEIEDYIEELKNQAIDVIEKDKDEQEMQNKYPWLSQEQIQELAKFLKQFRKELDTMSRLKNPAFETGESENETLEEELKSILDRVISRSIKEWEVPRFPVDDGFDLTLIDPVQLYIDTQEWRDSSYSYMEREITLQEELKIVKVRRRKVLDASGSMEQDSGKKLRIQQQIEVIDNKVTAQKQIELNELSQRLDRDVRLETETWQFGIYDPNTGLWFSRLKALSSEFDELEQASVWQLAGRASGGTNDFDPLEAIFELLVDENNLCQNENIPTTFERIRLWYLVRQIKAATDLEKKEDELDDGDTIYFQNLTSIDTKTVFLNLVKSIPIWNLGADEIAALNTIFQKWICNNSTYKKWIQKFISKKILSLEEKDFFLNLDIEWKSMKDIYSEWLEVITNKYPWEKLEPILEVIEVSSDGGSNRPERLQNIVLALRSLWIIVVAYGIWSDGRAVEQLYANSLNPKEWWHYCNNLLHYPEAKTKTWSTILDNV